MPTDHAMDAIVISDLHLQQSTTQLNQRFIQLLQTINSKKLFILGDLFEVWVGDDIEQDWLQPIKQAIKSATQRGLQVFFQHGNRDFLLGHKFCSEVGMQLLPKEYSIALGQTKVLMLHGDSLCTDDKGHMRFCLLFRNPLSIAILKLIPKKLRIKLALKIRSISKAKGKLKPLQIMDVNATAVARALAKNQCDVLIHGHTHRPNIHHLGNQQQRYVLGDWGDKYWWITLTDSEIQLKSELIATAFSEK